MQTNPAPIVAIMGNSGSGKTTLATALEALPGFKHIRFSYPMKRFLACRYGVTLEFLDSQAGKQTRVYSGEDLTYGDVMIRLWEACQGDRPLMDARIWLAESAAEIDSTIDEGAKALVFSDIRKAGEATLIDSLVNTGHPLHVYHLSREAEDMRLSDVKLSDFTNYLRVRTPAKNYHRCHDRPLTELVKSVTDTVVR